MAKRQFQVVPVLYLKSKIIEAESLEKAQDEYQRLWNEGFISMDSEDRRMVGIEFCDDSREIFRCNVCEDEIEEEDRWNCPEDKDGYSCSEECHDEHLKTCSHSKFN